MPVGCRLLMMVALALPLVQCGCAGFGGRQIQPRAATASLSDAPGPKSGRSTSGGGNNVQQASYEDSLAPPEESDATLWESMSPLNWTKSAKSSYRKITGTEPRPELARRLYQEAENLYRDAVSVEGPRRQELLMQAAEKYAQAAARWPDSALEQDGLYMAGESYFFADAYPKANGMYEKLIKKYPGTKHMDTIDARRYAIAQWWLEVTSERPESFFAVNWTNPRRPWRDTRGHALRIYDKIRIDDPTGRLADDATLAAANAHFVAGNFFKADEYYGDLRKAFPSSEHQFKAHFLGLKTKLMCYQGSSYSGEALDEAEKLIKQIRKQFPQEAEREKEFLARAWAEVRYRKAEREWDMAQYFVRRGEYGAARLYQQTIIDEYEDTPFAERARQQMAEQAEFPDEPEKPAQWLVKLFPREKPAKPLFYNDAPPK